MKRWTSENEKDAIVIVSIIRFLFLLLKKGGVASEKLLERIEQIKEEYKITCDDSISDCLVAERDYREFENENRLINVPLESDLTEEEVYAGIMPLLENFKVENTEFNKGLLFWAIKLAQSLKKSEAELVFLA